MMNGSAAAVLIPGIGSAAGLQCQATPVFGRRPYGRSLLKQDFDAEYIERLRDGDRETEEHFTSYFGSLLRVKLNRRGWSVQDIEDMCQETFLRVLLTVRKSGVERPECIGAYVNSVCNNVMLELCRSHARHPNPGETDIEPVDNALSIESILIDEDRKKFVLLLLEQMPPVESRVLRMVFLEETDRDEICKRMNIRRDYLRVILHRALMRFKLFAERPSAASAG